MRVRRPVWCAGFRGCARLTLESRATHLDHDSAKRATPLTLSHDVIDAAVDALLTTEGELRAGALLARLGMIPVKASARPAPQIAAALNVPAAQAIEVLDAALQRADALGLAARFASTAGDRLLARIEACHRHPPEHRPQGDLFADDPTERQRRELHLALLEGRTIDARRAFAGLHRDRCADPAMLDRYATLLAAEAELPLWCERPADAAAQHHDALSALAVSVFGREAGRFLRRFRVALGEALEGVAFDAARQGAHASRMWTLLREHGRARASIEADPAWRVCAVRLRLHAEVSERLGDAANALADWRDLCLISPDGAERALPDSALLGTHCDGFLELDLDAALPWTHFPAWAALCRGVPFVAPAEDEHDGAEALRIAVALRDGLGETLALRRRLQVQCPVLLRLYLESL
jgi:hypothetical protein